jgi:aspartyl-tRNA(Asn)/glutamyl-tRNA(Gln) amidotransferase subunit C
MIHKDDVRAIIHLARLDEEQEDLDRLTEEFAHIVNYVEQLQDVDTSGIEPTAYMERPHDALRDDIMTDSLTPEEALSNAPRPKKGHFGIPKIIG